MIDKLINNNLIFVKFLFISLPIALISGPLISEIICIYSGISIFIYSTYKKNFDNYNNSITYFFIFTFIYLNINSFFSIIPEISFVKSLTYLRIILYFIAIGFIIKKFPETIKYFYICTLICLLFLTIDSLAQFFLGYNLIGLEATSKNRITSFFGDEQIMGSFTSRFLPLILGLLYLDKNKKKKNYIYLIIFLSAILIFLSGERLALVYFLITFFFYFILNFKERANIILLFVILISVLTISLINKSQFNRLFKLTFHQLQENKFSVFSYRHENHFLTAYNIFNDSKLLGHGIKSFRYLCAEEKYSVRNKIISDNIKLAPYDAVYYIDDFDLKKNKTYSSYIYIVKNEERENVFTIRPKKTFYFSSGKFVKKGEKLFSHYEHDDGCSSHPHNIYMQFLSEIGLIGFILYFSFFLYILKNLIISFIDSLRNENSKPVFFISLCIFLSMFPFLPSGNYFNNWMMIISYIPIGVLVYIKNNVNTKKQKNH